LTTALVAASWAPAVAAAPYRQGEIVVFTGVATDEQGQPIANLRVVLEVSRKSLSMRKMRREEKGLVRQSALTDGDGNYRFRWRWHSYYNLFRLMAVDSPGSLGRDEDLRPLETVDVTAQVKLGGPVVTPLVVRDADFLNSHRAFLAGSDSADQQRIYEEMGKPDRVERMRRGSSEEISWFYFARGLAYCFLDGTLAASEDFAPVKPF